MSSDTITHPYDTPGLSPRQFLEAVMKDSSVPIMQRNSAAKHLLKIGPEHPPSPPPTIIIHIGSIFPGIPDTHELYKDLMYLKWCYKTGTNPNTLDYDSDVEGHA
jgi:hypothetical protein